MAERGTRPGGSGLHEVPVRRVAAGQRDLRSVPPCPACAGVLARPVFEVEGISQPVVVCTRCGLGRFHPMPGADRVRSFYPHEYYGELGAKFQSGIERLVRVVAARHIAFLSGGLAPGSRVLDVGCGRGVILGALADRGFEVHGLEISAAAARGADPRAQIRIAASLDEAAFPERFFDQVIFWHVLEHLAEPNAALAAARRMLKPGGRLIVAVPNFSSLQARWTGPAWFHLDPPRHLYHYPLAALEQLLVREGFEIRAVHHFSLRQGPFGWIQSFLNCRAVYPRNGLYTLLHERATGAPPPYDARTRRFLWLWLLLGAPVGLALTLLETALRSGATVHLVAFRGAAPARDA